MEHLVTGAGEELTVPHMEGSDEGEEPPRSSTFLAEEPGSGIEREEPVAVAEAAAPEPVMVASAGHYLAEADHEIARSPEPPLALPLIAEPAVTIAPLPEPVPSLEAPVEASAEAATGLHHFVPASKRPIDVFVATVLNEMGLLVGSNLTSRRRGQGMEVVGLTATGIQRKTTKGTTAEIPLESLEWAIKQLYLNGELSRSRMSEKLKDGGSTMASSVFLLLDSIKYFESTELPLTLHFYKLQWEDHFE